MTRHRLQREVKPVPKEWGFTGIFPKAVVVMCDGHRLAGVIPRPSGAPATMLRTATDGAIESINVNAPGDVVESLTRPGFNTLWRLDGVAVRSWATGPDGEPVEVPARPFACRRHPGGHYLDGAALRQVVDDATRRRRQLVVPVARVSRWEL